MDDIHVSVKSPRSLEDLVAFRHRAPDKSWGILVVKYWFQDHLVGGGHLKLVRLVGVYGNWEFDIVNKGSFNT